MYILVWAGKLDLPLDIFLACPSDKLMATCQPPHYINLYAYMAYGLAEMLSGGQGRTAKITQISNPSKAIMVGDSQIQSDYNAWTANPANQRGFHIRPWWDMEPRFRHGNPNPIVSRTPFTCIGGYGSRANFVFLDGHAAGMEPDATFEYSPGTYSAWYLGYQQWGAARSYIDCATGAQGNNW